MDLLLWGSLWIRRRKMYQVDVDKYRDNEYFQYAMQWKHLNPVANINGVLDKMYDQRVRPGDFPWRIHNLEIRANRFCYMREEYPYQGITNNYRNQYPTSSSGAQRSWSTYLYIVEGKRLIRIDKEDHPEIWHEAHEVLSALYAEQVQYIDLQKDRD